MKKFIATAFTMAAFMVITAFAYAQPAPSACNEGRALGAAHSNSDFQQCILAWQGGSFWDLDIYVTAIGGKDGCLYTVEAWVCPACHGPNPCPKIACRLVATLTLGTDFSVTSMTCY